VTQFKEPLSERKVEILCLMYGADMGSKQRDYGLSQTQRVAPATELLSHLWMKGGEPIYHRALTEARLI